MAGMYLDVPGHKMAMDRDGTQWFKVDVSNTPTAMSATEIGYVVGSQAVNQVNANWNGGGTAPGGKIVAVFPEKRDIVGVFTSARGLGQQYADAYGFGGYEQYHKIETSVDTTNGIDGTWVQQIPFQLIPGWTNPYYRSAIKSISALGVKGIRASNDRGYWMACQSFHVYGSITPSVVSDRLEMWHPTLDLSAGPATLDWGDVPRGTTETRSFRVKNVSTVKTANTPRVALAAVTETSPTIAGQHTLSIDGGTTWLAQVNLPNLAPGVISGVVQIKRVTPTNAVPSLWNMHVYAEATSWT